MIKRELFEKILPYLEEKEILMIVGPRQAGKTTLMFLIKEFLEKKGKKTFFFNLDTEKDRQFFVSQQTFISQVKINFGNQRGYVFIDEIQRKENAGLFLKGIYDMNLPYKFIVSGSGSLELKEKIHESLAGRKFVFSLYPLSFREFINFRTQYRYQKDLAFFFKTDLTTANQLLFEYLNFGGYPRVVLSENLEMKNLIINEIFQSFLEKDILYLLGLKKTEEFVNLVKILSSQIGQPVNFSELSLTLGLSLKTVKLYLWYLEKTFVLKKMTPFYSNVRKEIVKMPLYYFEDLGLRNFAINQFGNIVRFSLNGFLFQNFIYQLLKTYIVKANTSLHFWRTKEKTEVDFILRKGNEISPIEVKSLELKKPSLPSSLLSFIRRYQPKKAYLINLNLETKVNIDQTEVFFLPYWRLIVEGSNI